jgi:small GTP-binding protein
MIFISIRQNPASAKDLPKILEKFQENLLNLLKSLADQEVKRKDQEQFPGIPDQASTEVDYSFKIIVVGDPMVGKSSTILQYTEKAFRRSYIPTIGVNLTEKVIRFENYNIQLILWDLAGQSKYQRVRRQFYGGAMGAIMVYDLTQPTTFKNISYWYKDIKESLKTSDPIKFILCGNKKDRTADIKIPTSEGEALATKLGVSFFETSALTGENIDETVHDLIRIILPLYKT